MPSVMEKPGAGSGILSRSRAKTAPNGGQPPSDDDSSEEEHSHGEPRGRPGGQRTGWGRGGAQRGSRPPPACYPDASRRPHPGVGSLPCFAPEPGAAGSGHLEALPPAIPIPGGGPARRALLSPGGTGAPLASTAGPLILCHLAGERGRAGAGPGKTPPRGAGRLMWWGGALDSRRGCGPGLGAALQPTSPHPPARTKGFLPGLGSKTGPLSSAPPALP